MIKLPEDIVTPEELCEATGRKVKDINIEITGITVEKSSLELVIDTRLNFVMPRNLETVIKERILSKLGYVNRIRINYMYSGIQIPKTVTEDSSPKSSGGSWSNSDNNGAQYRSRKPKDEPVHENAVGELILMGKDFLGQPVDYQELENYVGTNEMPVIEGEVFKTESMPIRNDKTLITILVASKARTFCIKQFVTNKKFEELDSNLKAGTMIRAKGPVEYDTFEHENILRAKSIKTVKKTFKEDTYPNGRRVELHCHSKMSDNDGFNEVEDIVNYAAR